MNQVRLLSHIVLIRVNHRYEQCQDARAEKSQLDSIKIWQVFDGLNQGFGGVANTIKNLIIAAAGLSVVFGAKQFIDLASSLQTTQAQMASLTRSSGGQQGFGQLYNQVLGKPILSRRLKSSLYIIGYGLTAQQVIPDMDTLGRLSIVSGANLQNLAGTSFGQVTSRGASVWTKMLYS